MISTVLSQIMIMFGLIFGSITDIKTREIPDYLNYGLIVVGVFLAIITSIIAKTFWPIIFSLSGLLTGYIIGAAMFYTGQWGGGDAKMLMAIGAIIGLNYKNLFSLLTFPLLFTIIITILFAGAFYGIIYIITIAIKHRKTILKEIKLILKTKKSKRIQIFSVLITITLLITAMYVPLKILTIYFIVFALISLILPYIYYITKIVENQCMIKTINLSQLTEGDWIVEDIKIKNKIIYKKNKTGIEQKDIDKLKSHKIKKVKIKEGIPFIPGFLLGYTIILFVGNWIQLLIK